MAWYGGGVDVTRRHSPVVVRGVSRGWVLSWCRLLRFASRYGTAAAAKIVCNNRVCKVACAESASLSRCGRWQCLALKWPSGPPPNRVRHQTSKSALWTWRFGALLFWPSLSSHVESEQKQRCCAAVAVGTGLQVLHCVSVGYPTSLPLPLYPV